jgi:LysM repeat protein
MKKQLNQLRRFFARTGTRKLNAATAREVIPASYDDDDSSNRLSGAFIVVLALHVVALVGVFAFSRMKDPKPGGTPTSSHSTPAVATVPATDSGAESASTSLEPVASPAPAAQAQFASLQSAKPAAVVEPARPSDGAEFARPASRAQPRTHLVKNGENLTKIALAWGVRPADLMVANNLKNDEIRAGQELIIPDAKISRAVTEQKSSAKTTQTQAPAKSNATSYTVRKNDTLVKIARDLGVRYEDLTKINGIKDPRKLQEGQVLKVPKKS